MKNILITGASSGFGRLTAELLAQDSYHVFATMRDINQKNKQAADELKQLASEKGLRLETIELDVTTEASVNQAVQQVSERVGTVDVLVNNAGFSSAGYLETFTVEQIQQVFETNVFGVLRVNRAVLPLMRQQRSGLIINTSALMGQIVMPFLGPYNASKHALEAFSEILHYEMMPFGIQSVLVEPGYYSNTSIKFLQPANTERLAEYGELADLPTKVLSGSSKQMNVSELSEVAELVKTIIETAPSERKLRYTIGAGAEMIAGINQASETAQKMVLQMFGMNQ